MNKNIPYFLLMTLGMSVINWRSIGSLQREIQPYVMLYNQFQITTVICDFSSNASWLQEKKLRQDLQFKGIEIVPLYGNYDRDNRLVKYLISLYIFLKLFRNKQYVIIKTNQTKGSHFAVLLKITKQKVFFLHRSGYDYKYFTKKIFGFGLRSFLAYIESAVSNFFSDRIHLATDAEYNDLPYQFMSKARVLPNWSDKYIGPINKSDHFLFVGRLTHQKNIVHLLLNFPKELKLTIVGDGPQKDQVSDIIERRQLSVVLYQHMEHQKLMMLMKQSRALICCSEYEGNPKVVIEAIVNRVPVVIKNGKGLDTLFLDNTLGIKFSSFKSLASILEKIDEFQVNEEVFMNFQKKHSIDYVLEIESEMIQEFLDS